MEYFGPKRVSRGDPWEEGRRNSSTSTSLRTRTIWTISEREADWSISVKGAASDMSLVFRVGGENVFCPGETA